MSTRTRSHHHHSAHASHEGDRHRDSFGRRSHGEASPERRGYAIVHGGRQWRFGPLAFWSAAAILGTMAVWSAGTASYFAFRDDLLTRLITRQAEMQYAYEDRIAELRAQVDRLTSRQLLDQEQVEQRIENLARRQGTLESRTTTLSEIPDALPTGSIPRSGGRAGMATPAAKPSPISDTIIVGPSPDRHSSLESRAVSARSKLAQGRQTGIGARLASIEGSLDRVEARQSAFLLAMEDRYDAKAKRMRSVLADLGIDAGKLPASAARDAVGGPFIPVRGKPDAAPFERQLSRIAMARTHFERLNRALLNVPVRRPMDSDFETSSGFGVRLDPFLRAPAMHSGLDFRAPTGERVRATGAGTVTIASWHGGYGRMVEIDHGNGLTTRYAHLSEVLVRDGQRVQPGQFVGRVGSTGRSTGPHLHYETRLDGEALDPRKFLRAGVRLGERL